MVHIPNEYKHDYWEKSRGLSEPSVNLSCMMPNGVFIPFGYNRDASFSDLKEDLWEEATKFPLHGMLHDSSTYVFSFINSMAESEELNDESRRLCDVQPFGAIIRLIERKGDKAENMLNTQISHLIGKGLHEFDALKNTEVNDFRWKMKVLGDEVARGRCDTSWVEKMHYHYPPRLLPSEQKITQNVESKLRDGNFVLHTKFEHMETTFSFNVPSTITPHNLLVSILNKKAITLNMKGEHADDFLLKVCGREEYLLGEYPLIQFTYIQEALARDVTPTLVTVSALGVLNDEFENVYETPEADLNKSRHSSSTMTLRKKAKLVYSWEVEEKFVFKICAISRLNCDTTRPVEVCMQAGLFHGGKSLCESQKTGERAVSKECCEWEQDLTFDLKVCNLPRMARLCLVVYENSKTAKGVKSRKYKDAKQDSYINPLAWVNTTVYDFKNQLKTGAMTLYMWTYAEDSQTDDILHPLGTVVSNPNVEHATALTITFHKYSAESTVLYPSLEKVLECAAKKNSLELFPEVTEGATLDQLRTLAEREQLYEMHEQEKKALWKLRYYCRENMITVLPKLLECVEWNDYNEVCEVTALIHSWPKLPVEKALELLDYAYADQTVRSFAVDCLKEVSDEDLSLYLLQLVQALKHESFLYCDLVEFLLRRGLRNQKIGHWLFWHLRSEMQVANVSVRFGLLLEAYCRGSQVHMRVLAKQVECLEKLKNTSDLVRQKKDKDKAKAFLIEHMDEIHVSESISGVLSPLDPSFRCKRVKTDRCRVMDSKMKPLWVVFENDDPYGDDIYIIFKNGDDLRQDMLTLQMLRIMDRLWKKTGRDYRMNPYGCISTSHRVGMIEVVLNAETIANIQKEKGMFSATSAFRKGSLLAWLKDHNPTETALNKAIEEFTLSCAGYCVATYVLGVADRHSDNIMVKKSGQLFHIDFGHILGHFKEKFGFRRERVPFVLTHDFVHVINKGQTKKEAVEFQQFQEHCEQAFLILRRHGGLILSLFAMMISTGLPELSSEKDLNYLRDTLVLEMSEEAALHHFQSKFDEALGNSWKTSLNWASHNMAKNNN